MKPYKQFWGILFLFCAFVFADQQGHAQPSTVVISDTSFNVNNWSTHVTSEFGATETISQHMTGGNPGAFLLMQHILPPPANSNDLPAIDVTYIFDGQTYDPAVQGAIDSLEYSEDITLVNNPWLQSFRRSYPAIEQDGRVYRADVYIGVNAVTNWTNGFPLSGLDATYFYAADGSRSHPDFSEAGSPMKFGFSRNSRYPVFDTIELILEHGIDNFTFKLCSRGVQPGNQSPIAKDDNYYVYPTSRILTFDGELILTPLENDWDPDGDVITIDSVGAPLHGAINAFDDSIITYQININNTDDDTFYYDISDGELHSGAYVHVFVCTCPLDAMFNHKCIDPVRVRKTVPGVAKRDTVDLNLFHRLRDEVMGQTEAGMRIVNMFYEHAFEITKILFIDHPDLRKTAVATFTMMQAPVQSLLEEDSTAVISQALVDTLSRFLAGLSMAGSPELQQSIAEEMIRLDSLNTYVGLTIMQATEKAIGDTATATSIRTFQKLPTNFSLNQNFPNPFNPITSIAYDIPESVPVILKVFNMKGQVIQTLVNEKKAAGHHSVQFNAQYLSSGLYLYSIQTPQYKAVRKMIFMK